MTAECGFGSFMWGSSDTEWEDDLYATRREAVDAGRAERGAGAPVWTALRQPVTMRPPTPSWFIAALDERTFEYWDDPPERAWNYATRAEIAALGVLIETAVTEWLAQYPRLAPNIWEAQDIEKHTASA